MPRSQAPVADEAVVLVVDDDLSMRQALSDLIESVGLRVQLYARVPQSEAAQVIGHERAGITFGTYNPEGMASKALREVVEKMAARGCEPGDHCGT